MKKIISLLIIATFLVTSCEGDRGPQGPQGPPGEGGVDIVGITYEYDVEFQYNSDADNYTSILQFPQTEEPSDAILVYRLETVDNNGENLETWNLIPKTYFLDEGTMQYSFNHTDDDVELLITADFDLNDLDSNYTENQYFRVVVVPSDFEQTTGINTSSYDAVMNALNIEEEDIKKVSAK